MPLEHSRYHLQSLPYISIFQHRSKSLHLFQIRETYASAR